MDQNQNSALKFESKRCWIYVAPVGKDLWPDYLKTLKIETSPSFKRRPFFNASPTGFGLSADSLWFSQSPFEIFSVAALKTLLFIAGVTYFTSQYTYMHEFRYADSAGLHESDLRKHHGEVKYVCTARNTYNICNYILAFWYVLSVINIIPGKDETANLHGFGPIWYFPLSMLLGAKIMFLATRTSPTAERKMAGRNSAGVNNMFICVKIHYFVFIVLSWCFVGC